MERTLGHEAIVEKLRKGEKFGLFEDGEKCYFRDGARVSYQLLWKAIRTVNGIEEGMPCRSLAEECPDTFVGSHWYKHSRHDWKRSHLPEEE